MAAHAKARAVPLAVVVTHRLDRKARGASVAGVAAHGRRGKQLSLVGDMVGRHRQTGSAREVTGLTAPGGDAGVIESRRDPCDGAMAGVAGRGCREMPCWLARRDKPGVTGGTRPRRDRHVVEARAGPGGRRAMAGVAGLVRLHVIGGLERRCDAAAGPVTVVALSRRAGHLPADVAIFAGRHGMHAGEREGGAQVVEGAAAGLLCDGQTSLGKRSDRNGAGEYRSCPMISVVGIHEVSPHWNRRLALPDLMVLNVLVT